MKGTIPFIIILLFIGFLSSCSDSIADLSTDDITLNVKSENLEIRNHLRQPIYYFAVESGTAAVIKWAPFSTNENRVNAKSIRQVTLDEIHGYQPGKTILFYYWSDVEPDTENIKFKKLETP